MFCCKKRKARKAAKAQAIVSSLAAVESALEGKTVKKIIVVPGRIVNVVV